MRADATRYLVTDELMITVTVQSKGNWGHSFMTDQEVNVRQALDSAADDIQDKIRRMPKKQRG